MYIDVSFRFRGRPHPAIQIENVNCFPDVYRRFFQISWSVAPSHTDDDVAGPHVGRCVSEHRAQPDVSPAGRGEREFRQACHREPRQEAEGEAR